MQKKRSAAGIFFSFFFRAVVVILAIVILALSVVLIRGVIRGKKLRAKNQSKTVVDESVLIERALKINRLDCDNKNKGNNPKVSKFQKVVLDQYLDEALFLMMLIGITVFNDKKSGTLLNTIDTKTKLALGKRAKSDAIAYLSDKGVTVGTKVTYAVKQPDKDEFWANPRKSLLYQDWWLILNDNKKMELIVLNIPKDALQIKTGSENGLLCRVDKQELIDLNINTNTLEDRKSGISFDKYIVKRIKY